MAEDMNTAFTADADDWSDITADSFADVEDDAQGAPDAETQGNDAAPEIEQNDGGQDADAAQPGENEEQQAQTDGQLFELKHLGETKNVNRDEVVTLAQKGMDYDRVTEKNTQLENQVSEQKQQLAQLTEHENALQELVSINPKLNITHDASLHDMYYMNQDDKVLYKQKMAGGTKELLDSFKRRHRDDSHMLGLIFRDPNWLGKAKADKLADRLFKLASNVQSTELRHQLSLYDIFTDEELYQHWLCNNAFWYLTYGPSTVNGGNQPFSQRNLLHKIISQADSCIALPHPGATLRYGHDTMVMPLVCLLDLNGYGRPVSDIEQLPAVGWCDYRIFPMACNVQWIFYRRSVDDKDVLVKILLNEDEARLPISTDCAPYYHWSDVRRYYLDKLASYKPQPLQK